MSMLYDKLTSLWRPDPPVVRAMKPADSESCARLHAQAFARGWSVEDFRGFASNDAVLAHVAVVAGRAGVQAAVLSRRAREEAELLTIMVDVAARKQGLGRLLLMRHLAELAARDTHRLFLEVDVGNTAAKALYSRFYFREVGSRKGYYRGADGELATALILRCDFH